MLHNILSDDPFFFFFVVGEVPFIYDKWLKNCMSYPDVTYGVS